MLLEKVEQNVLIAERVKPGDRWVLTGTQEPIYESLTDALEAYYYIATVKPQAFRLEPMQSKLFAIVEKEQEVKVAPVKRYNIYGDPL